MRTDLNRLEQLWGMALLNAGFGVWDLDLLQQTVNYSPEWKLLLGYESVDAPDSTATWRSRVHPEDLAPMLAALSAHLKGSSPGYECEFRLRAARCRNTTLHNAAVLMQEAIQSGAAVCVRSRS